MVERGSSGSPLSTLSSSRWEVVRSTVRKPRCWSGAGLLHLSQHVSGCLLAGRGSSGSPLSALSPSRWEVVRSTVRKPRCWSGAGLPHLTQHVSGYLLVERGSSGLLLSSPSPSRWGGRLVWRPDSHSTSQVQGRSRGGPKVSSSRLPLLHGVGDYQVRQSQNHRFEQVQSFSHLPHLVSGFLLFERGSINFPKYSRAKRELP